MICAKSYQSIPDDPRDNILSSEDYFDMFYSELCKRNGVKDFSDEEYEIIRRWWYEFENGSGNDTDSGCDKSVEDMKSELKDFDEGREKHTCETCERKRCDVFCKHCRTGCNDDYTMTDYWHSYTQVEQRLWNRIAKLEAQNKELQCCANCRHSYGGEEEPSHDCGYCHAMNCICKLKLKEHTSDIYRMWEDKCERWEMRVN